MTVFDATMLTLFGDPNLAEDALWRPGGTGAGQAIRIDVEPNGVGEASAKASTHDLRAQIGLQTLAGLAHGSRDGRLGGAHFAGENLGKIAIDADVEFHIATTSSR